MVPGLPDEASAAPLLGRVRDLGAAIGYAFRDWGLLSHALTHPSSNAPENYQRLEFLGDAVLQLCVSTMLYERSPDAEGSMTRRRQQLVSASALARIAQTLGLGDAIRMDASLARQGGREQRGVLADALEAVLGAVFLDGGLVAADGVVRCLWEKAIQEADAKLDPKGALQALAAELGLGSPVYEIVIAGGTPSNPLYEAAALVGGRVVGRGQGKTKRAAHANAASAALESLAQSKGQP